MSDVIDFSKSYPKKHEKPEKTPHRSINDEQIEIIEELSELVKLGKAGKEYCLIIDNQVYMLR